MEDRGWDYDDLRASNLPDSTFRQQRPSSLTPSVAIPGSDEGVGDIGSRGL